GDEEGDELVHGPLEVPPPAQQVVLVAAEGVALGVDVVLQQVDASANALLGEPGGRLLGQVGEDRLAGPVLDDDLAHVVALGGGVLRVGADVEVEPAAVAEEDVGGAPPLHDLLEQVAGRLVRPERRSGLRTPRTVDRDPVLGLQADDAGGEGHCPPFCTNPLTKDSALVSSTVSISSSRSSSSAAFACAPEGPGSGGGVGSSGSRSLRRCCS